MVVIHHSQTDQNLQIMRHRENNKTPAQKWSKWAFPSCSTAEMIASLTILNYRLSQEEISLLASVVRIPELKI